MTTNPKVFKTYDIRGVYKEEFDEELAYRLGLAFVKMRSDELGRGDLKLVVARDMRLSSPTLHAEVVRGITDAGATVIDIGLASTPTFYFAVANYEYDGGIQISASHNPKEYNGFKLVRERALPIGAGTGMEEIQTLVMTAELSVAKIKGTVETEEEVLHDQVAHDLASISVIDLKPFKIVIDPANAMGAQYFEELFIHLPGELIKMNWELDGTFPAHQADPLQPENMLALCEKVKEEGADLGIATDGDGDRIFFVDNLGVAVEPGIVRAVLAKIFLEERPGSKIAYDIRPGRITPETIIKHGGTPIVTHVGHSLIKAQAVQEGAFFAGESSGHFFLNMEEGCYEVPMIVALKVMLELSKADRSFAEYLAPYKKYFNSGEINSKVENVLAKLSEIKETYKNGKINELDGVTVEFPDFWFNVRASNTEAWLRLNLEAVSEEVMLAKRDEVLKLINS
ncbi:phosphomannomutase/phosphoglucomutase [Candidatus Falkowbacteria bacterium CG10_big_fil_rev_8_21_14_0_10_37_14]|uniref:Phosphomannomutase/phosphoglucomutase n=1 Tax=Candidatus Falkowbacteria bacterium CG10_big_fil_rev_8_21_14_0_10_37_14 TaxID=1974561 RepID=A0A2M6WTN1_9BACT|nr:phosphomannomutase/phosphoglucomutase [Candidatus Falkowbacteria bacterium]PIT96148.1 MAG: phosphomannomutase/phosphoglucomutase [Candidatus Falkowbacteria bacterium CG10_big_fil_rev_8_21_14_0_10_37_14]